MPGDKFNVSSLGLNVGGGADMTVEVQDYVLLYAAHGITYEIHLIDSPGFDDDIMGDVEVLKNIATYINITYKMKETLAGVLYLHDITKAKIGGVGKRNIRMLERLIGLDKFENCAIVTTKWQLVDLETAEARETSLRTDKDFFGSMLQTERRGHDASLCRYSPKNRQRALEIIKPFLKKKFTAEISLQMVASNGPKLPLGKTEAGKLAAENLEQLAQLQEENQQLRKARETLSKQFDESLYLEFKQKSKELRRKIRLHKAGRWIMRFTIVGGAVVATVLTLGPGAAAFAREPAYEKAVSGQRRDEKRAKANLEKDLQRKAKSRGGLLSAADPQWLWDSKVKSMEDLRSDRYSIKSASSEDLELKIAQTGGVVGFAAEEGMAESDLFLRDMKDISDDSFSEDSD
ncbi:hypothetical protein Q9189_006287 [Teloschistes chrysophthalmus]